MGTTESALLGALIGAGASLLGLIITQWFQSKRDRLRVAAELAITEQQQEIKLAEQSGRVVYVAPVSAYVIYHDKILRSLARGTLDKAKLTKIKNELDELLDEMPTREV